MPDASPQPVPHPAPHSGAQPVPERPIIPGFHPDPSVCRVGDDFYLVNSSFEYFPGVPIWHSTDLRMWRPLGHVLDRVSQLPTAGDGPSGGIYAPTIRHHDGRFWMITTHVSQGPGQLLVHAERPEGPWSEPIRIRDAHGIDPDLAWDEDGRCWITWAGDESGRSAILQAQLDLETGALLTEPQVISRGSGGQYPEGPHLFRRGEHWYLLLAEGGTERGHMVTIARGPAITGPFEPSPSGPLLTARSTSSPTQSTGHADLIERADGSWAMVFLGTRPRGGTPGWHVLGRETFACEIDWIDGWPVVRAPIEPAKTDAGSPGAPFHESLSVPSDGAELPTSWASPSRDRVLESGEGGWTLHPAGAADGAFAGRRQQHERFEATARVMLDDAETVAGLEVRIDPNHRFGVYLQAGVATAVATIGGHRIEFDSVDLGAEATAAQLVVAAAAPTRHPGSQSIGPDDLIAAVESADGRRELGRLDGRYVSTEVAGGFTGRFVGVWAHGGRTTVGAFDYTGADGD